MTQVALTANPPGAASSPKHDSTCPFCAAPKPPDTKNDLSHDAPGLRVNTDAADNLGTAQPHANANGPKWRINYNHPATGKAGSSDLRSNPHHCIPANASLKGHPILEYVQYDHSNKVIADNIGYDVNKLENGVWLPTIPENFYAGNDAPPVAGIRWGALTEKYPTQQFNIAEAAMHEAKRQFHDAHPAYSGDVKDRLTKIHEGMHYYRMKCPEATGKSGGNNDVPAPYGLVNRLDGLSRRMAQYLDGDPLKWRPPLFTSRHAEAFHAKVVAAEALKKASS